MTNANWEVAVASFLMTANEHSYVLGLQSEFTLATSFPFLIKVDGAGQLDWYRIYGTGSSGSSVASGSAVERDDGTLEFGTVRRSVFDTSGTMLSTVHYTGPGEWTVGASTYSIQPLTGRYGDHHLVHGGWLHRVDDLFEFTWRTPLVGRVDLNDPGVCGWTASTLPLAPDTIVPSGFIEYEDLPTWIPVTVNVADTAMFAFPVTLPITPYCSVTGIGDEVASDPGLLLFPSLAQAGSSITVQVHAAGNLFVWNAAGQRVHAERVGTGPRTLGSEDLAPGIYTVQLIRNDHAPSDFARLMIE